MVHYSEGVCIDTNIGGSKKEEIGECVANEMLWIGLHYSNEDIQATTYLIPILHFQQTEVRQQNDLQGQDTPNWRDSQSEMELFHWRHTSGQRVRRCTLTILIIFLT